MITILGSVVFATTIFQNSVHRSGTSLDYSFGMAVAGGALKAIAGVLVYVGGPRTVTAALLIDHQQPGGINPPPIYTHPTESYLVAQYTPPPAYRNDKATPPSYFEHHNLLPPPYEVLTEEPS